MVIRQRVYPTGTVKWELDCGYLPVGEGGASKRVKVLFASEKEARREMAERKRAQQESGNLGLGLSPAQRVRYAQAEAELSRAGLTIEEAVRIALEHGGKVVRQLSVEQLALEFFASREKKGLEARSVKQLRYSLGSFMGMFGTRPAQGVTVEDVDEWLEVQAWAAITRRKYLGDLRGMFSWALKKRLVASNPAKAVELPLEASEEEITTLAPGQCEQLLRACATGRGGRWVASRLAYEGDYLLFAEAMGYLALAIFFGVRPEELVRAERADLDLDHATFLVRGKAAKTGQRRVIELSGAGLAWLHWWARACPGLAVFCPIGFRRKWRELRQAAGCWPWPNDVLRHTAATMHYATHQSASLLKAQLGHHEAEATLHRHYRAVRLADGRVVSQAIAAQLWALTPERVLLERKQWGADFTS